MKRALMTLLGMVILVMPAAVVAGDCGDVNNNDVINILDITYLINYVYRGGPAPVCGLVYAGIYCADLNNDCAVNILDITYNILYVYKGGPKPQCGCGCIGDVDDITYHTIVIGDQCWMTENLKVTHYRNGDPIPHVTDIGEWGGLYTGAYCNYLNDEDYVPVYGRLYNWFAVDDSRNIAPAGWHVPTDAEWMQLEMYLGMSQAETLIEDWRGTDEGGKLKEVGTIHWQNPNTGATNETIFTALPGGHRSASGYFDIMGYYGTFWSSMESSSSGGWYRALRYNGSDIYRYNGHKNAGFSVRCVKD